MRLTTFLTRPALVRLGHRLRAAIARAPRTAAAAAVVLCLLQGGAIGAAQWALARLVGGLPSIADVRRMGEMAQATVFYDVADQPAFTIFEERRFEVALADVSPHLVDALVAIEDQRFRSHMGVDLVRIVGAMLANVREGRLAQGGSTLTQQLARQSFLTLDKTYTRKIQEVLLAFRIERQYTKDQILELYLNKMYFGAGLYGAEAASMGYFGKPARELTVAEAALLAGLVKSPSTWAPTVNLERAVARRNVVLAAMRESGSIDEPTFEQAREARVVLKDALRSDEPFGRYFKEQVRLELVERFGRERVYQSGLRVYTTIDVEMQKAAEAAVAKTLADLDARRQATLKARRKPVTPDAPPLQAALVAIDPRTGAVRAMVGGRSFADSRFNRAMQARRQPGSAFKTFVYAAALESGYTPASLIDQLDEPIDTLQGAWTPEDGHSDATEMTIRAALKISSNRAAVRMLEMIGPASAVSYAGRLGLGNLPAVPSLALGSGEVTLFDMTSAYGAFAAGGVWHKPSLIRRVEDLDGQVLFAAEDVAAPAMPRDRVPHDVDARGRHRRRHGLEGAADGLPAAGGRQDRHHQRLSRRVVRRLHEGARERRLGGLRHAEADPARGGMRGRRGRADVGAFHGAGDGPRRACAVHAAARRRRRADLPALREAAGGRLRCRAGPARGRGHAEQSMIATEYFAAGTEPGEVCHLHVGRSLFGRLAGWLSAPGGEVESRAPSAGLGETAPAAEPQSAPAPQAAEVAQAPEPEKKRGFWSRIFGRRDRTDKKKDEPPRRRRQ
ncbi:MAG: transglycosylase domain-containing protein [Vicinamibacterales bacterium]